MTLHYAAMVGKLSPAREAQAIYLERRKLKDLASAFVMIETSLLWGRLNACARMSKKKIPL